MYQYNYKLYIFSDSMQLEEGISGISDPEGLTFTVETFPFSYCFSFLGNHLLQDLAVIILNPSKEQILYDRTKFFDICTQMKQDRFITDRILCIENPSCEALSLDQMKIFQEIWTIPFTNTLLQFHYTNLMNRIKLERDYRMAQIYLDTTIDSIPDLVWYKDIRGAHIKVNAGFCSVKTREVYSI